MTPMKLKTIQKLLGFDGQREMNCQGIMPGERTVWMDHIQLPFKPMGLILWGASEHTFIDSIQCGNQCEGQASCAAIPGRFFEVGKSFDDIVKLAELGELDITVPQRAILKMASMSPGMTMRITTIGPFSQFCVWGTSAEGHGPMPREVTIEKEGDRFVGTVVQHSLDGPETLLTVHAPSSSDCASILNTTPTRIY